MFAPVLLAALATAAPADGTYSYVSTMNGAQIARTSIVVEHQSGGVVLTESGSGTMNGQSGSVEDTLTLGGDLAPVSYTADASIADSKHMQSTLAFDAGTAKQTGDVSHVYPLLGASRHFAIMDIGPFSGFFMLPAQMHAWRDPQVTAIVPNFAQSLPLAPDVALKPDRPASVPAGDVSISFSSMVELTLWYNPATYVIDRVDIPSEGLVVRRV